MPSERDRYIDRQKELKKQQQQPTKKFNVHFCIKKN